MRSSCHFSPVNITIYSKFDNWKIDKPTHVTFIYNWKLLNLITQCFYMNLIKCYMCCFVNKFGKRNILIEKLRSRYKAFAVSSELYHSIVWDIEYNSKWLVQIYVVYVCSLIRCHFFKIILQFVFQPNFIINVST